MKKIIVLFIGMFVLASGYSQIPGYKIKGKKASEKVAIDTVEFNRINLEFQETLEKLDVLRRNRELAINKLEYAENMITGWERDFIEMKEREIQIAKDRLDRIENDYKQTLSNLKELEMKVKIATFDVDSIPKYVAKSKISQNNKEISKNGQKIFLLLDSLEKEPISKHPNIEKKIDSIRLVYESLKNNNENLEALIKFENTESKGFIFLNENKSVKFYKEVYDIQENISFNYLNSASLNFGKKSASIQSELISSQLYFTRISLSALVSKSQDDEIEEIKEEEAYQRLLNNGGNMSLKIEAPLYFSQSLNKQRSLLSMVTFRGSADIPEFGLTESDFTGNLSLGINIFGQIGTTENEFNFYFNLDSTGYYGTKDFKENLAVNSKAFLFANLAIGVVIKSNIKVSFSVINLSSEKSLRNKNLMVGTQIL